MIREPLSVSSLPRLGLHFAMRKTLSRDELESGSTVLLQALSVFSAARDKDLRVNIYWSNDGVFLK